MIGIRTVLCSVDLSPATERQLDLTAGLCRTFHSRLVLHHNAVELAVGAGVGWMWAADHQTSPDQAEHRLRELARHVPDDIEVEMRLTHGPVAESVLAAADAVDADVIVLDTHGTSEAEHGGITARVLERASRSVFAFRDRPDGRGTLKFGDTWDQRQVLLVPTDLTEKSRAAVDLAFDLARRLPTYVHLLHVTSNRTGAPSGWPGERAEREVSNLVPADLRGRADARVESGDPARTIAAVAHDVSANCIVMGEHPPAHFRHWFHPDTPRGVLDRAPCSVWYVPGQRAA